MVELAMSLKHFEDCPLGCLPCRPFSGSMIARNGWAETGSYPVVLCCPIILTRTGRSYGHFQVAKGAEVGWKYVGQGRIV